MKPHFLGNVCLLMGRSEQLLYFALVTHPAMLCLLNCLYLNPQVFLPFTFLIDSLPVPLGEVSSWLGGSLSPGGNPRLCPNNEWFNFRQISPYRPICPAAANSLMLLILLLHKRQQRRKQTGFGSSTHSQQVKVTIRASGHLCAPDCSRAAHSQQDGLAQSRYSTVSSSAGQLVSNSKVTLGTHFFHYFNLILKFPLMK